MPFNILAAVVGLIIALTTSQLTDVGALAPPGSNYTRICGGVNIPYPFGLEPDCAMPGFNLTCEETADGSLSEIYEKIHPCMEEIKFLEQNLHEASLPAPPLILHTPHCVDPGWTASKRGLRRGRVYMDDYMDLVEEGNFTFGRYMSARGFSPFTNRTSYLDSSAPDSSVTCDVAQQNPDYACVSSNS